MSFYRQVYKQTNKVKRLKSIFFCLIFSSLIFLSGCVHYDVEINFHNQNHGKIVQHISVVEQLSKLSPIEVDKWLESLEDRTRKLRGKVKRISKNDLLLTIPFSSSDDLVEKFNSFFSFNRSSSTSDAKIEDYNIPHLQTQISIKKHSFLLAEYNQLNIEIDLRDLNILSEKGNTLINPKSLADLEFTLSTPWSIKNVQNKKKFSENFNKEKQQISWKIKAGEINRIDTAYWTPNYLGLGFVCICLITLSGIYIKNRISSKV